MSSYSNIIVSAGLNIKDQNNHQLALLSASGVTVTNFSANTISGNTIVAGKIMSGITDLSSFFTGSSTSISYLSAGTGINSIITINNANNNVGYGNGSLAFGFRNTSSGYYSGTIGGFGNIASANYSVTIGGKYCKSTAPYAISAGLASRASGRDSVVGGGFYNYNYGRCAVVSGGLENTNHSYFAFIGSGQFNKVYINSNYSSIQSGYRNRIYSNSNFSNIVQGKLNKVNNSYYSTVLNGNRNSVNSKFSSIINGSGNTLSSNSNFSVILNGSGITSSVSEVAIAKGFSVPTTPTANATAGVATLSSGSHVVSTTKVTNNSMIFVFPQDTNTSGSLKISARTAGTSFTITSSSGSDSGVVAWLIIEPA